MESKEIIDGVIVKPLKVVRNERGHLMEIQRNDEESYPGFGQAYVTSTLPGVVKAWYRHHKQIDQIALVKGELLLVLYDSRPDSDSFQKIQVIHMTESDPLLVQIPTEIWHGFQARGNEPAFLVHLNSIAFSFGETDEDRLPPDDTSIPYDWPSL
jgi:dTDP-4-dehydrorhamnose 3,5-epimerase